jgi:FkbM family methyltransferase
VIRVLPRFRSLSDIYEPALWNYLRHAVRPGDTVIDVGAHIGLYTVAFARWVGPGGRVIAIEPDAENFNALQQHLALNRVRDRVRTVAAVACAKTGSVAFVPTHSSESRVARPNEDDPRAVQTRGVTLDDLAGARGADVVKIDVEGYEREVLEGATELLRDPQRRPRVIAVELHAFAWPDANTLAAIHELLAKAGYAACGLDGSRIDHVAWLGQMIATAQ